MWWARGDRRTTCGSQFSACIVWVPETELRLEGLVIGPFTHCHCLCSCCLFVEQGVRSDIKFPRTIQAYLHTYIPSRLKKEMLIEWLFLCTEHHAKPWASQLNKAHLWTSVWFIIYLFIYFAVLGIKPMALCMPGKCSSIELHQK